MHAPDTHMERAAATMAMASLRARGVVAKPPKVAGVSKHIVLVFEDVDLVVKATRDYLTDQQGEAHVLAQLTAAPVPRLAFEARPERRGEWSLLWLERLHSVGEVELPAAMAALHELHRHLDTIDRSQIMTWRDSLATGAEASNQLPSLLRAELLQANDRWVEPLLARDFPMHVLHGDAYFGNALNTAEGVKWIDFENLRLGPIEYDLAVLDDATGYPDVDEALCGQFRRALIVNGAIWRHRMAQVDARHEAKAAWSLDRVRALT